MVFIFIPVDHNYNGFIDRVYSQKIDHFVKVIDYSITETLIHHYNTLVSIGKGSRNPSFPNFVIPKIIYSDYFPIHLLIIVFIISD